jgi:Icc protein
MRLVVMGDFHYSRMENAEEVAVEARDRAYSIMLDSFLGTEGQVHISLGDLTHDGYPEEFRSILERTGGSGRHFIHVLGNHDTHSLPKAEITSITGQQRYSAIDTEEALLLFLDTTKEMNRSDWGGELDAEQLAWLQARLEESGEKPVLVFAHHPVYDTTAFSAFDMLSIHPDIGIQAVLRTKKGPGFYFCGHNHVNSIVKQDNWHYIQTAACLDVPAFRTVELEDGQFRTELVAVEAAELAGYIAAFNTKIEHFTPAPDACGEKADYTLQVNIG